MYCTRSRALSIAKPSILRGADHILHRAAILLPASRLISCAFAAISATVSRTSALLCPELRLAGAGTAGPSDVDVPVDVPLVSLVGFLHNLGGKYMKNLLLCKERVSWGLLLE